MNYRAAVIGCGRIGCAFDDDPARGYVSTHAGAYVQTPGFDLVALADPERDRLERYGEKFDVPGRYRDHQELFAGERLDAVSICTGSDTHAEITGAAVDAGVRAVFCEKPMAESLATCDEMIDACAAAGTVLLIDHQRRFDRFHRDVAELVVSGGLGRVQQVSCYYTAGVANTGTHLVDLLCMLLGAPTWVEARPSSNPAPTDADPNVDGWIGFEGGTVAALQALDVAAYTIFEVNLLAEVGRLRIGSHGFSAAFEGASDSTRFAGYRELYPGPPPVDDGGPREYMLQAMAHLRDCLDGTAQPWSSGADGRRALELVTALRLSAADDGRTIDLPLSDSTLTIPSR